MNATPTPARRKKTAGDHLKDLKLVFGADLRQFGMILALLAIVLFFQIQTDGKTLEPGNLINVVQQYSYILVLAIGMVMVIIAGHIDLSVGSVAATVGICVALLMKQGLPWVDDSGWPWWAALLAGLVLGALIGAWQGFWVAYWGVPAFIVTLAGMMLFRGANQWIGSSTSVPVPEEFAKFGAGYLPEVGPDTGYNNLTLLLGLLVVLALVLGTVRDRVVRKKMGASCEPVWVAVLRLTLLALVIGYFALKFASGRVGTSFPYSGLILVALVIFYSFLTSRTVLGRHIYAVGGNGKAAVLAGVDAKKVHFFVMANMSVLAALAGMMFVARSYASGPGDGNGWELDAIAAVFIGGAAVAGGVGTVTGSIVGGLVMAFLNNGLALMGVGSDKVQVIKGLVLLIAVAVDVWNKREGRFSIIGRLFPGTRTPQQQLGADSAVVAAQVGPGGEPVPASGTGPQAPALPELGALPDTPPSGSTSAAADKNPH